MNRGRSFSTITRRYEDTTFGEHLDSMSGAYRNTDAYPREANDQSSRDRDTMVRVREEERQE